MLAGCKKNAPPGTPPAEVRIGYFPNLTHAQAVLGVDSGAFAKALAPSQFSARTFNAGPSLIEALVNKQIDIGYVGPGPALSAFGNSGGQSVRVVAGAAGNGVLIVARKDSGLTSLKDLAGRNLATPQKGNTQDLAARHFVSKVLGADLGKIKPIPNAEQAAAMARGDVDAAWAPEPWGSRLVAESGATVLAQEKDIKEMWPEGQFALTVVITTPEFLRDHPEVVEKVLKVHHELTARLTAEPEKQLPALEAALAKLGGGRLPAEVLEAALKRTRFTEDPGEATFARMAEWSQELGFARQPGGLERLFDLAALKRVQAAARGTAGSAATMPVPAPAPVPVK